MSITPGAEYIDLEFTNSDFRGYDLTGCTFESCSFVDCNFSGMSLKRANIVSCEIQNCDLSNVIIANSRVTETNFKSSKLLGVNFSLAEDIRSVDFESCNLNFSAFRGLKLKNAKIVGCRIHEGDFQECDLTSANFSDTDFLGTTFRGCVLAKADFSLSRNYQIDPTSNKVNGAKFSLPEAVGLLTGFGVVLE